MISFVKRPLFLLALLACSLGFLFGAHAVSAATSTVCASGCDYTTLGGSSGALFNVGTGDVIAVEPTYTSTTEPVFPLMMMNPGITLDCQNNPTWVGSTSTDYSTPDNNTFYLSSTSTIRNCSFGNINIVTGSYVSGVEIRGNTFHSEAASSTISFNNGAALFTIEDNTNIGAFSISGSTTSSNGVIRSNSFYYQQRSSMQFGAFVLGNKVRDLAVTGNTFSFYAPVAGESSGAPIVLTGDQVFFATNTLRFVEPQSSNASIGLTAKPGDGGFLYIGGNYITTPATTTCNGIQAYPNESATPVGSLTLVHNTIHLASTCAPSFYAGGTSGIVVSDNMTPGADLDILVAYNAVYNAGSMVGGGGGGGGGGDGYLVGFFYDAKGAGSVFRVTEDYNGFYRFLENVKEGSTEVSIGTHSRTNDPLLRIANLSSADDLDVVPFSSYLDVDGTRDIGATNAARRSTVVIDSVSPTVDYSSVDATSTSIINSFIRTGDTVTLAAGAYDSFSVSSTDATNDVTITGAGNSTIITSTGGDGIYLRGVTTSTLSSLRVMGATVGASTYSTTKLLFSYSGNDYNDSQGVGFDDPDMMAYYAAPGCEIEATPIDGLDISSLTSGGTVPFNVALGDVGGAKITILVPGDLITSGADLETDCGGMVSVDQFITGVFVPSAGEYTYDAAAVASAGASLLGGLSYPAITRESQVYAGIRLVNASGWTIDQVTSTNNAVGVWFEGTTVSSTVRDSVIVDSDEYDVRTSVFGRNYLDNTLFDRTSARIDMPMGDLLVKFRMRALVTEADGGDPIVGVYVTSTDDLGTATSAGPTVAGGYTNYIRVPAYRISAGSSEVTNGGYNPYVLSAEGDGFAASSTSAFNLVQPDQTVSIAMVVATTPTIPAAPTTVAVGSLTATTAAVTWVDVATDEDTYHYDYIDESIGETFPSGNETSVAADTTSASLTGLLPNRQYRFRVWASNIAGNSTHATSSVFYTLATQSVAPTVSTLSRTTASLSIPADGNSTSTEYAIYNSTVGSYVNSAGIASATPSWQTTTTWGTLTISGLTCGTSYSFVTIARNLIEIPAATSTATGMTTSACATSGGGGGGGGGAISGGNGGGPILVTFNPVPPTTTLPVSSPAPIPTPVEPTPAPAPTPVPQPEPTPAPAPTVQSFVEQGTNPASRALGTGERQAILRDLQEVLARSANQIPVGDLERVANGQIPLTRNLAYERSMVPRALATFRTIYGHAPNFRNTEENLAWNTLMYRIRFTRNLTAEREGIAQFRRTFRTTPQSPFQWSVVRVLGYVR